MIQDAGDSWMSAPFSDTLPNTMSISRERCARERTRLGERFLNWAESRPDIRAVALVGSGARDDHPADQWSDLDFVIVASDAQSLLSSTDWLADIGASWFSIVEKSPPGETIERRALFEDGCDMDFIVVSSQSARGGFPGTFVKEIASRGVRVLLDKDAVLASLPGLARPTPPPSLPSPQDFSEVVSDFWFHAAWTAKKLKRGELWVATSCCDAYMKRLLLRMVEWHARVTGEGAPDTWFDGRFLEQWASPRVVNGLRGAFAHYDAGDVWSALSASMGVFHRIATETAAHLRYDYPAEKAIKVADWVHACGSEKDVTRVD